MPTPTLPGQWVGEYADELGPWYRGDSADDVFDAITAFDPDGASKRIEQRGGIRYAVLDVQRYLNLRPRFGSR